MGGEGRRDGWKDDWKRWVRRRMGWSMCKEGGGGAGRMEEGGGMGWKDDGKRWDEVEKEGGVHVREKGEEEIHYVFYYCRYSRRCRCRYYVMWAWMGRGHSLYYTRKMHVIQCTSYSVQCTKWSPYNARRIVCSVLSDRRTMYAVHLHCMRGIYSHTIRQLLCLHMYMRVYVGTYLYVCVCVW